MEVQSLSKLMESFTKGDGQNNECVNVFFPISCISLANRGCSLSHWFVCLYFCLNVYNVTKNICESFDEIATISQKWRKEQFIEL